MFAALKWGAGMIDMWMQSVETVHRWLNIVQIGRALIQMLAVKADAATTALAQVAACARSGISPPAWLRPAASEPSGILRRQKRGTAEGGNSTLPEAFR